MKLKSSIILYIPYLLVFMFSCEKEKVTSRDYPRVKTLEVTDITSSGVKFNAEIFYNDGMNIINHGFVWGEKNNPNLGNYSEKVSLGSYSGKGDFSYTGTYGMEPGSTINVRAYLITEQYTIYGDQTQFISQGSNPPVIKDFSPKSASMLDTILIHGQNFSTSLEGNIVSFGEETALVIESSSEQLRAIVPSGLKLTEPIISVSSSGHTVSANSAFSLLIPEFKDFSPKTACIGQSITISGNNICLSTGSPNQVWFGNMEAIIISATREELVVEVTENINSTSEILRVSSFPVNTEFTDSFRLAPPVIDSFSPTSGGEVIHIRISGTGFHKQRDNNKILFGGIPLNASSSTSTAVIFIIPPDLGLSTGDYKISVTTLGLTTEAPGTFHFIAP